MRKTKRLRVSPTTLLATAGLSVPIVVKPPPSNAEGDHRVGYFNLNFVPSC